MAGPDHGGASRHRTGRLSRSAEFDRVYAKDAVPEDVPFEVNMNLIIEFYR